MLAPEAIATAEPPASDPAATNRFKPAIDSAPAGSSTERVSSKASWIAAQTVTTSSSAQRQMSPNLLHRDAVDEDADVIERHAPLGRDREGRRIGVLRLDADHADLGADLLNVRGDPRCEPAANRHEDGAERTRGLVEKLETDRRLAAITSRSS
jgi:hypothetical protein